MKYNKLGSSDLKVAEICLGTWLSKQQRDKLIVATKITPPDRGFNWVRGKRVSMPSHV